MELSLDYATYPDLLVDSYKPVKGQPMAEGATADPHFDGLFATLSANMDKWDFAKCKEYFSSSDCECEFNEPFEGETDGDIRAVIPGGKYTIRSTTWPRKGAGINYESPTASDLANVTLADAEFCGGRYRAVVDDNCHWYYVDDDQVPDKDSRTRWSIIDGELYTRVWFASFDDLRAVFFSL